MVDLKKPVNISLIVIVVSFLVSMGILYISHPSWIQRINSKGKVEIAPILLISYSITFSLVCGVAALILSSKKEVVDTDKFGKPPSYDLSPSLAYSFIN